MAAHQVPIRKISPYPSTIQFSVYTVLGVIIIAMTFILMSGDSDTNGLTGDVVSEEPFVPKVVKKEMLPPPVVEEPEEEPVAEPEPEPEEEEVVVEKKEYGFVVNELANTVSVIDMFSKREVDVIKVGYHPVDFAISENGGLGYAANEDGDSISVIDMTERKKIRNIKIGKRPKSIVLSPNGNYLLAAVEPNHIEVVDLRKKTVIERLEVGKEPSKIILAEDAAYVVNSKDDTVSVIDINELEVVEKISVGKYPVDIILENKGTKLYVLNQNSNSITVVKTRNNEPFFEPVKLGTRDLPVSFALDSIDRVMIIANREAKTLLKMDIVTKKVLGRIKLDFVPGKVVLSDDENGFLIDTENDRVHVLDVEEFELGKEIYVGQGPVNMITGYEY